jgi:hypothetical protein
MQLPKYKKKKRVKLKKCQEPGCGREFWGHPIAKYCDQHRDIKARQKPKKVMDSELRNMYFKHGYNEPVEIAFGCCLEGCENTFTVKMFPKQYIYPRFCLEHRNDFKRSNFIRTQKKKAIA